MNADALHSKFDHISEEFFKNLRKELEKINLFFSENIARASRSYMEIEASYAAYKNSTGEMSNQKQLIKKSVQDMKFAISEIYLMLKKIEIYRELNFTGFRKLTKKHDKILQRETGKSFMKQKIEKAAFWKDKNLGRQLDGLEEIMVELHNGNHKTAMERLRVPPIREVIKEEDNIYAVLFMLGFQLGGILLINIVNGLLIAYGEFRVFLFTVIVPFKRPPF